MLNFRQHLSAPKRDSPANFFICIKKSNVFLCFVKMRREHHMSTALLELQIHTQDYTLECTYTHTLRSVPLKA